MQIQDCDFADPVCTFDIPQVVRFKYSGTVVPSFHFQRMNKQMQEVYLDFGLEERSGKGTAQVLANLVHTLSSAKTLTVCSYLLQVIQHSEDEDLQPVFKTRHLVMKTSLKPKEFIGIRYMINNCQDLESLTFEVVPLRPTIEMVLKPIKIVPVNFWENKMSHKCLERTLKVVKVKNFGGSVGRESCSGVFDSIWSCAGTAYSLFGPI